MAKLVEIWGGIEDRRVHLPDVARSYTVTVYAHDGAGVIEYRPSGLHANDGIEIWTPQVWKLTSRSPLGVG